jgi:hypothetical protein
VSTAPIYFPQFVDGGGYVTSLLLLNTSGSTQNGTLEIFDGNGTPLVVRQSGGVSGASFAYAIPAGGALAFQTDGLPPVASAGWVKLTPATGSSAPVGAGLFQLTQNGVLVTESGVPSATPTTQARIFIDKSNGRDTGLALANPGDGNLNVTLKAFQTDGTTPAGSGSGNLTLGRRSHQARFAAELVSGLPTGFTGVFEITAPVPFVALTLRSLYNARGDFLLTTFPIADADRPAPEPIVFPQIADGGGFTTQFILLSPRGDVSLILRFFGDDGTRLGIAKQ